jgi:hypothetical protein
LLINKMAFIKKPKIPKKKKKKKRKRPVHPTALPGPLLVLC